MAETTAAPPQPAFDADVLRLAARAYERDRYLTALLAPRSCRGDLIALAAFAGEIARIPSFVDEPMMGEIRLQWWRDALTRPIDERIGHPIADAVRNSAARHAIPIADLEAVIDAHAERLDDTPPADDAALLAFLDHTEGTQLRLAWRVLSGDRAAAPSPILITAGRAYGIARLLLELPAQLAEGRTLIPESRLAAYHITLDALRSGTAGLAAAALLATLAADARRDLVTVRASYRQAPWPLRNALLPTALIEPYLKALERAGDDPRHIADVAPLTRVWRLWAARRLGRI